VPPKNSKKRLMISATVVSAALGMAAAPAAEAIVTPASHAKPPPFNDPTFHPTPVGHLNVPPFSDPKFFPKAPLHPEPSCLKPPPGIEPV
jgi:hypothetical protein